MTQKSQLTLKSTLEQLKNGIEEEKEEQILQSIDKLIQQQQQQQSNNNKNNNNTTINKNILPLAQQCKIIYFIMKLDYQKALDYILNHNLNNNIFLIYKCYCLFRLNKLQDALNEIKNIKNDDHFILLHLKAQIYYRLGMYEESSKVYEEEILKNKQEEEENEEILTNLIASYTLSNNKKALDIKPNINTYELEYNKACAYLHLLKDYQQAEKYLEFSVQLMKSSNNSNHGGEDSSGVDENELGSIMVQLAYVKYLKGNLKESQEIYEEQLKKFTSKELVALAVAQNNLIALLDQQNTTINNNQTIMDESILKKLKFIFHEKMLNKLTMEQMKGVTLNHCLLLLKLNKLDECEKLVKEELIKLYNNENNNIPNLILLSIYMKQNKNLNYLMNNYKLNNLTKIQIYLNLEKYKEIIEIINNDNELNNYLSIKCLLIFIYMKLNNYDKCIELYLNLLKENNNLDKSILLNIGNLCCDLQLKLKKYNDATDTLKLLLKLDKNNYTILSKLIQVLTFIDLNQAEHYLNELSKNHHINITSTTLNVDELEKTSINTLLNTTTSNATTTTTLSATTGSNNNREKVNVRQKDALERGEKRKKTKKRKNKLPKEMNGEVPDPLRWESKKVNKKEATGVGHQGSADTDKQGKLHHAKGQKSILKPEEILPKGVKKQGGSRKKR